MSTILEPSVTKGTDTDTYTNTLLVKENYLSEFSTEEDKAIVRENLGVYSQDSVFNKDESLLMMNEEIHKALESYYDKAEVEEKINSALGDVENAGYVLADGSVPFIGNQQLTVTPASSLDIVNVKYVSSVLTEHCNADDPHGTEAWVKSELKKYALAADTYTTDDLYTRRETDSLLGDYVKKDGSTPFTGTQIGVDPTIPSHLATMRYVLLVMQNHNSEADPHGFMTTLNKYLSNYYTKSETYTKAQTYSRSQLLDIIQSQMDSVIDQRLAEYEANEGSVSALRDWVEKQLQICIKADGSVAHYEPQIGVPAVHEDEFITLGQATEMVDAVDSKIDQQVWVTSGPVQTTVGFVEDNSEVPARMTLQEVCDAIFYGTATKVVAPDYSEYGSQVCITITTHSIDSLECVEVYKNGVYIGTILPENFEGTASTGYTAVLCDPSDGGLTEDSEWKADFHYTTGETLSDSSITRISYPIFVGAVPYWWNAQEDITIESLTKLVESDPENNQFISNQGPETTSIEMTYNFADAKKRSLVVVIPYDYPDLENVVTPTQTVDASAFAKWVQPLYPDGVTTGVLYKIYVYNIGLVQLDQTITFNFTVED